MTEQNITPPIDRRVRLKRQIFQTARSLIIKLVLIITVIWVMFGMIFGVTVMNGEDMYPHIKDGDLIFYFRLPDDYNINDIVTFTKEGNHYIGRIVAQGGDEVDFADGHLIINGNIRYEDIYYPSQVEAQDIIFPYRIPQNSVFILGDYRTKATDSRKIGAINIDELDGKVITIIRRRGL